MVKIVDPLLSCKADKMYSDKSIKIRKFTHPLMLHCIPLFMEYKQVIECKNKLLGINEPDEPLKLPEEAVIWCPNHGFKDDVLLPLE